MSKVFLSMTISDLREQCKIKNLPSTGLKAHLIARLSNYEGKNQNFEKNDLEKNCAQVGTVINKPVIKGSPQISKSDVNQDPKSDFPQLDKTVNENKSLFEKAASEYKNWELCKDVHLDFYNSDLNMVIESDGISAQSISEGGFEYMFAGCKATYGINKGKVYYEVKIIKKINIKIETDIGDGNVLRLGWSSCDSSLVLGEENLSYAYDGTGKTIQNGIISEYGVFVKQCDVVGCFLEFSDDSFKISFSVNGINQGVAFDVKRKELGDQFLIPHIYVRNMMFEVNFGAHKDASYPPILVPKVNDKSVDLSWVLLSKVGINERHRKYYPPKSKLLCEVLMMIGLPGCGKTTWVNKTIKNNPEKLYNVLSTDAMLEKMKITDLRNKCQASRWEQIMEIATKNLHKLLELAVNRRRNFILDQTNVYSAVQCRRMKTFEGFTRKAVIIVPTDTEYQRRINQAVKDGNKEVSESVLLQMRENFVIPEEKSDVFKSILFVELQRPGAENLIKKYRDEAKSKKLSNKRQEHEENPTKSDSFAKKLRPNDEHLEDYEDNCGQDSRGLNVKHQNTSISRGRDDRFEGRLGVSDSDSREVRERIDDSSMEVIEIDGRCGDDMDEVDYDENSRTIISDRMSGRLGGITDRLGDRNPRLEHISDRLGEKVGDVSKSNSVTNDPKQSSQTAGGLLGDHPRGSNLSSMPQIVIPKYAQPLPRAAPPKGNNPSIVSTQFPHQIQTNSNQSNKGLPTKAVATPTLGQSYAGRVTGSNVATIGFKRSATTYHTVETGGDSSKNQSMPQYKPNSYSNTNSSSMKLMSEYGVRDPEIKSSYNTKSNINASWNTISENISKGAEGISVLGAINMHLQGDSIGLNKDESRNVPSNSQLYGQRGIYNTPSSGTYNTMSSGLENMARDTYTTQSAAYRLPSNNEGGTRITRGYNTSNENQYESKWRSPDKLSGGRNTSNVDKNDDQEYGASRLGASGMLESPANYVLKAPPAKVLKAPPTDVSSLIYNAFSGAPAIKLVDDPSDRYIAKGMLETSLRGEFQSSTDRFGSVSHSTYDPSNESYERNADVSHDRNKPGMDSYNKLWSDSYSNKSDDPKEKADQLPYNRRGIESFKKSQGVSYNENIDSSTNRSYINTHYNKVAETNADLRIESHTRVGLSGGYNQGRDPFISPSFAQEKEPKSGSYYNTSRRSHFDPVEELGQNKEIDNFDKFRSNSTVGSSLGLSNDPGNRFNNNLPLRSYTKSVNEQYTEPMRTSSYNRQDEYYTNSSGGAKANLTSEFFNKPHNYSESDKYKNLPSGTFDNRKASYNTESVQNTAPLGIAYNNTARGSNTNTVVQSNINRPVESFIDLTDEPNDDMSSKSSKKRGKRGASATKAKNIKPNPPTSSSYNNPIHDSYNVASNQSRRSYPLPSNMMDALYANPTDESNQSYSAPKSYTNVTEGSNTNLKSGPYSDERVGSYNDQFKNSKNALYKSASSEAFDYPKSTTYKNPYGSYTNSTRGSYDDLKSGTSINFANKGSYDDRKSGSFNNPSGGSNNDQILGSFHNPTNISYKDAKMASYGDSNLELHRNRSGSTYIDQQSGAYNNPSVRTYNDSKGLSFENPIGGSFSAARDETGINSGYRNIYDRPTTGSYNDPKSGSYNDPKSGSYNDPKSGSYNDPKSGAYNDPKSGSYNDLRGGSFNDPKSDSYNDLRGGSYNYPKSGSYNDRSGGSYNDPKSVSYNDPKSNSYNDRRGGSNNDLTEVAYNDPRGISYSDPKSGSYNDPMRGSYNNPKSGSYNDPKSGSYNDPRGGSYNDPMGRSYDDSKCDSVKNPANDSRGSLYANPSDGSGIDPQGRLYSSRYNRSYADTSIGSHIPLSSSAVNSQLGGSYSNAQYGSFTNTPSGSYGNQSSLSYPIPKSTLFPNTAKDWQGKASVGSLTNAYSDYYGSSKAAVDSEDYYKQPSRTKEMPRPSVPMRGFSSRSTAEPAVPSSMSVYGDNDNFY